MSSADTIISDNIKNGETILGVQGTYDGKQSYKLYFNSQIGDCKLEINNGYEEVTIESGAHILVEDLDEREDTEGLEFKLTVFDADTDKILFTGNYNGEDYTDLELSADEDRVFLPPNGRGYWHKDKFQSDCTITVVREEKLYIYEKGEDSNVEFNLNLFYSGEQVEEGTDLVPGLNYLVASQMIPGSAVDIYVNENLIISGASVLYPFNLTEGMSVNNKVVITVKKHKDIQIINAYNKPLLMTAENKSAGDFIQTYIEPNTSQRFVKKVGYDYAFKIESEAPDLNAHFKGSYDEDTNVDKDLFTYITEGKTRICNPNSDEFEYNFKWYGLNYGTLTLTNKS